MGMFGMLGNRFINEIGNRYGRIIVIRRANTKAGRSSARWVYKCDCGIEGESDGVTLRSGSVMSCRHCSRLIDETGKRYGNLTVLSYVDTTSSGARWKCRCDCGRETIVRGSNLRNGETKSCNCLRPIGRNLEEGRASFNELYRHYKFSAVRRGLDWQLDESAFRDITLSNCYYCGESPKQVAGGHRRSQYGHYIYNGIDRCDPILGYVTGNIVPCCGKCNLAKRSMMQSEFAEWAILVYEHFAQHFNSGGLNGTGVYRQDS